ncbi:MAG: hypothetical protein ACKV0T_23565 [Planctomycetales bacterium]
MIRCLLLHDFPGHPLAMVDMRGNLVAVALLIVLAVVVLHWIKPASETSKPRWWLAVAAFGCGPAVTLAWFVADVLWISPRGYLMPGDYTEALAPILIIGFIGGALGAATIGLTEFASHCPGRELADPTVGNRMFQRLRSLFAAKPPVEFRHPEFGLLKHDSGLWNGEAQRDGRSIGFCIAGTDTAPDSELLDQVRDVIECFPEVERAALEFLRALDPSVRPGAFKFYLLSFLWEDKPHLYTLEFSLAGDDHGIWRVEFESGEPKYVGRDD